MIADVIASALAAFDDNDDDDEKNVIGSNSGAAAGASAMGGNDGLVVNDDDGGDGDDNRAVMDHDGLNALAVATAEEEHPDLFGEGVKEEATRVLPSTTCRPFSR